MCSRILWAAALATGLTAADAGAQYRPAPVVPGPTLRPILVPQQYYPDPGVYQPRSILPPVLDPLNRPGDCITPLQPVRRNDLERHVERLVKSQLGHCIRDIDVDIDWKRGRVEVEVELRHRHAYNDVRTLLYTIPELRGMHICIEVDD